MTSFAAVFGCALLLLLPVLGLVIMAWRSWRDRLHRARLEEMAREIEDEAGD